MGCVSSKILTKSASFREELNRSLRRRDEIIITKNNGDQFLALLCTANAVAQRLKESSDAQEPNVGKRNPSAVIKNANTNSNSNSIGAKEPDIETINTWELLDGLEDDNDGEEHQNAGNDIVGPSRSFRTVEDFDALVAAAAAAKDQPSERSEDIKKEAEEEGRLVRSDHSREKGSKRKAMAKELTALKVPGFEFARGGSLREWLSQGGQVFSPGSYITPKFGNFVSPGADNGDINAIVFDPELVEQFERAMEQLTIEEEGILKEIIASLEGSSEETVTCSTATSTLRVKSL